MNAEELKQLLESPVAKAFANGEAVQRTNFGKWEDVKPAAEVNIDWLIDPKVYRIKPKPLVVWVNEYPDGIGSCAHKTRPDADTTANASRIRCVKMIEAPDQSE